MSGQFLAGCEGMLEPRGRRYGDLGPVSERRWYTPAEDARIRREFPHTPTAELAAAMNRTTNALAQRAMKLGVHKAASRIALRQHLAGKARATQKAETPRKLTRREVAELKRLRLIREMAEEAAQPLNRDAGLTDAERQAIRDRVRSGKKAQSVLCGGTGSVLGVAATSQWRRR